MRHIVLAVPHDRSRASLPRRTGPGMVRCALDSGPAPLVRSFAVLPVPAVATMPIGPIGLTIGAGARQRAPKQWFTPLLRYSTTIHYVKIEGGRAVPDNSGARKMVIGKVRLGGPRF